MKWFFGSRSTSSWHHKLLLLHHIIIYALFFFIYEVCVVFSVLLIVCAAIVFRVKGQDYIEEILTAQGVTSIDFDFSWSFYLCMCIFFIPKRRLFRQSVFKRKKFFKVRFYLYFTNCMQILLSLLPSYSSTVRNCY